VGCWIVAVGNPIFQESFVITDGLGTEAGVVNAFNQFAFLSISIESTGVNFEDLGGLVFIDEFKPGDSHNDSPLLVAE
jgi:hypothetical protein